MKDRYFMVSLGQLFKVVVLTCILSMAFTSSYAHGDLDQRIHAISKLIKQWPDSAALFVNRANLYFQHEEYSKSIADIDTSLDLGGDDAFALFVKAKSQRGLSQYDQALSSIDSFIKQEGQHVNAVRLKAKILCDLGEYKKAAEHFLAVIAQADVTLPENYLEAAMAYELSDEVLSAIAIVKEGLERLGAVYVLHDRLITLHINSGKYESALRVQKSLIDSAKRKEGALYRAALICIKANQKSQARDYLDRAIVELDTLPNHIRLNKAMRQLKRQIVDTQATLQKKR